MNWRDYWNSDTPIYVSERHKLLHYRGIASDLAALVAELGPGEPPIVLDHGCGEALAAERVAARCEKLYLCDAAPNVRARIEARLADNLKVTVLAPEEVEAIPDGSLDIVVANSLLQYLSRPEFDALLALWRGKLKDGGALVLADIIPHGTGAATDAAALLRFAASGGFLVSALGGLARTALSDYRKLRGTLGLARYDEGEMLAILTMAGFEAARRPRNIGHNQARMTFVARKSGEPVKAA